MRIFEELNLKYAIAGNSKVIEESKKYQKSKDWTFCGKIESARETF
jgi:hypothetical protein